MKLLKKLLPITTLTTTALCVCSGLTSCSKAEFSVSKLDFEPANKHIVSSYAMTEEEVAKDYFGNKQYFIEDMIYNRMASWNKDYISKTTDEHYSDVNYQMTISFSDIVIGDVESRTILDEETGYEFDACGSLISFKAVFEVNRSYTRTKSKDELDVGVSKEVDKTIERDRYDVELKNFFAFMWYEEVSQYWTIGLYVDKNCDWVDDWSENAYKLETYIVTKDGKETTVTNEYDEKRRNIDSRGNESDEFYMTHDMIGVSESYYLSQVTPRTRN